MASSEIALDNSSTAVLSRLLSWDSIDDLILLTNSTLSLSLKEFISEKIISSSLLRKVFLILNYYKFKFLILKLKT